MAILFALAKALEARDDITSAHSLNVTRYSMLLGQRLGLDEEQLRALGQGAMLHDLGKIGLPDNILKKPGKLNDIELERIREHPKLTSDILAPLEKSSHFSAIARSHHERWDGNGYPDGLNGEDIPLLARIVAIADTWDAMTSDRIYRESMSEEIALATLEREKHLGQWDPCLIDEFIKLIRQEKSFCSVGEFS
jgi:HD-GYP domain-containing protein (c-di-GMP phosphodiesterase class II)